MLHRPFKEFVVGLFTQATEAFCGFLKKMTSVQEIRFGLSSDKKEFSNNSVLFVFKYYKKKKNPHWSENVIEIR